MDDQPTSLQKMQTSAQVDAEAIAAKLSPTMRKAMISAAYAIDWIIRG